MEAELEAYYRQQLRRSVNTEERLREFLHGATGPRSPMYTGLQTNVKNLGHLSCMLDHTMILLAELTTDKDWRGFGAITNWGPCGMSFCINRDESWEENLARMHYWVRRYEEWLESPLERMARAAAEPE